MRDKLLVVFCSLCSFAIAQTVQPDTTAQPLSAKEKKKRDQKLRHELQSPYRIWLNVDVAYIITDEERRAFRQLSNDDERESFIEQFWLRRDPTPDTQENEFKEEHYRRIAYANEHFASGIPGWKTDRGRTYIVYGPPDEIDSHPSGGTYQLPQDQGGGQSQAFPFETWRYRYIERIGTNAVFEFVDTTMSGEYHITIDPTEKNALAHTPMSPQPPATGTPSMRDEFTPLELLSNWGRPPAIKYTDLEAMVSTTVRYNTLPMLVRTDFIPVTPASIYANITLQFSASNPTVNLYGRITTLSRRVVQVFEDVVTVDSASQLSAVYQKTIPLAPGRYRLSIAAKDVTGGDTATYEAALDVPPFEQDKLAASSLILADLIERVAGAGQFVIGDTKVRPRVTATFRNDEKLGIYLQLYHFTNGTLEYQITNSSTNAVVLDTTEEEHSASQLTVKKWLPLNSLSPGEYTLRITAVDRKLGDEIARSATFTINP
ncbi:MAG: GWxTD domain-containing protein [Bryobacteraceae bacterium]|jgi:GWxTD domain-containing protein